MKKISLIAFIVMMISGCQQQLKEFNDALANSYPTSSNSVKKFGWETRLPMVTEDEVCSAFRQNKESARAKYIGRDLIKNGVVQCVIEKPYAWNVGNVISLPRKKAIEEHARLVIEHGVYVSQKGKILTIENYSNLPNGSDCNISIDLSSFNGNMY